MIKAIIGITALLVGLTGPQVPAQAYCNTNTDQNSLDQCVRQEQRMNEIERQQREMQSCINGHYMYCN